MKFISSLELTQVGSGRTGHSPIVMHEEIDIHGFAVTRNHREGS